MEGRGIRRASRSLLLLLLLLTCGLVLPISATAGSVDLQAIEAAFVDLAQKVSPSVVAIETHYYDISDDDEASMVGSGVIIDADGLIVTNDHVVRSGKEVIVTVYGGRRFIAGIVASDPRSDLAVIKVDARDLVPAPFGDLSEVKVGQWAFAMGNPFGMGRDGRQCLSFGVVSALGKSLRSLEERGRKYYGNLIQTTADINPGNSGGPLFNIDGELIGINTAMETRTGISEGFGFAIPISERTRRIIGTLAQGGNVDYGFLGVTIVEPGSELLHRIPKSNIWGVVVTNVTPSSPAAQAQLRPDDLIVEYDRAPVSSPDHLVRLVGSTPVGTRVPLLVYRDRRPLEIEVQIGQRQALLGLSQRD